MNTCLKRCVNFWVEARHLPMFGGHWSSAKGNIMYLICQVTSLILVIKWEIFMVFNYSAKFGGHRYFRSRDIMLLVCHVIKQDHVIRGSGGYYGKNPSKYVGTLPTLVFIGTVVVEIQWFSFVRLSSRTT